MHRIELFARIIAELLQKKVPLKSPVVRQFLRNAQYDDRIEIVDEGKEGNSSIKLPVRLALNALGTFVFSNQVDDTKRTLRDGGEAVLAANSS